MHHAFQIYHCLSMFIQLCPCLSLLMTLIQVARGHLCTEESVTGLKLGPSVGRQMLAFAKVSGRIWRGPDDLSGSTMQCLCQPRVCRREVLPVGPLDLLAFLGFSWLFMAFHLSSGQVGVGENILSNKDGEVMRHPTQV